MPNLPEVAVFIKKQTHSTRTLVSLFLLVLFIGCVYYFLLRDLPSPAHLSSSNQPQSTNIYDRNGVLLYSLHGDRNQTYISLKTIPLTVQEATISIEDREFYHHGPIDFKGIARAFVSTVFHRQIQGGSTITQQLVKNTLLSPEQTITRKIKEALLSFATEALYPKDKILELYLNEIPYGGTIYGIEAASESFFGKHAKDLDLAESALLAGLPESPTVYSPFGAHPELAKDRQVQVLKAMLQEKYITQDQYNKAASEPLSYKDIADQIQAPHFVFYVKNYLENTYGAKVAEEGGLNVTTTLDLTIQNFAQDSVATELAKLKGYHVTNGAVLVTRPGTGEILAMVGSKDYFDKDIDGNVNLTTSLRQPGSSIKPITYATGLIKGYTAATPFIDQSICFPEGNGKQYCPVNYDGGFHGVQPMRFALGNSFNIPAVKMLKLDGISDMISTASAMGITTFNEPDRYGLSLTLGAAEVYMTDMATAYGVLANSGYRIDLHPVLKVTDRTGKVLEAYDPPKSPIFGKQVLSAGVTFILSSILSDNGARLIDFGPSSELVVKNHPAVAVKTGTTQDFRDNWTIGYTKDFVVTTWVGNNDNTPMNSIASGITGAAPIWNDIMTHLLDGKPNDPFVQPPTVIQKAICSLSGLLSNPSSPCATRFEYFIRGTEPNKVENLSQNVFIDKTTQDLAKPGQTDNVEQKNESVITDATGDSYCLTCPHPTPTAKP